MILYLAGNVQPKLHEVIADKAVVCSGLRYLADPDARVSFLFTFASSGARQCAKYFCVQPQRRIFVDSGAFSAWTQGTQIKLEEYIAFCREIMASAKCPVVFAALDVIAGARDGGIPTKGEISRACEQGWENYQAMKASGIPCLMTFHQFEHKNWLKRIADDSDYFAVSPRKSGVGAAERAKWLEHIFREFGHSKRIHGLGVSSVDWLERFPFYSADNSGWLQQAGIAHKRPHFVGQRAVPFSLREWEDRAHADVPTWPLREMLGYGRPGDKPDPEANSGTYWLMTLAMACALETEWRVTKLWKEKGVAWDESSETVINPCC